LQKAQYGQCFALDPLLSPDPDEDFFSGFSGFSMTDGLPSILFSRM
jgi:hypothetical protein